MYSSGPWPSRPTLTAFPEARSMSWTILSWTSDHEDLSARQLSHAADRGERLGVLGVRLGEGDLLLGNSGERKHEQGQHGLGLGKGLYGQMCNKANWSQALGVKSRNGVKA